MWDCLRRSWSLVWGLFFLAVPIAHSPTLAHCADQTDGYHKNVFGDPVRGLSDEEYKQFAEGYQLFVRVWPRLKGQLSNGETCIACHLEPMPGGSGTSKRTFVFVSRGERDVAGGHVVQRFHQRSKLFPQPRRIPHSASLRKTPPLFGLGLLEAAYKNQINKEAEGRSFSGLLGWRADVQSIDDFVERALAVEIGLRTPHYGSVAGKKLPDVSDKEIHLISQFIRFLGPPRAKRSDFLQLPGARLFDKIGCGVCHSATVTIEQSDVAVFRGQQIHPYSDLRRHDMGTRLADCEDETTPNCAKFRTAPLWGISSTGPPFLHDGRANTLEAAIAEHGGEAQASADAFVRLSSADRVLILDFLDSL